MKLSRYGVTGHSSIEGSYQNDPHRMTGVIPRFFLFLHRWCKIICHDVKINLLLTRKLTN